MEEERKKKILICIHSQKEAGWLMYQGLPLISMRPSVENEMFNVFFFYNNEKTLNAIKRYEALHLK